MKQIRSRVFETNSSSTHSITICTAEEFEKFSKGELLYDDWNEKLVPASGKEEYDGRLVTLDKFGRSEWGCMETYMEPFTTPSGDKMVAFGIYGYDG